MCNGVCGYDGGALQASTGQHPMMEAQFFAIAATRGGGDKGEWCNFFGFMTLVSRTMGQRQHIEW